MSRTALVTGASSGIGEACAGRLARSGWRVLAGVRRQGEAPEGTEELQLDVTDAAQIQAAAEGVDELHALVNNAGIAIAMPLEFVPLDELRHQLEVNLIGQVAVTQAFLPALRRVRGRIVFVGSIAGKSALPFLGSYAASKHALEAVADSLRLELRPWGIRVSIVEPGSIKTPIWGRGAAKADELLAADHRGAAELYGERVAAFRRVAAKRGAGGAPAEKVAEVVESALPFLGPYAASKHALEAVADSLRLELRPWGIRVSIVEPGSIKTPIWARGAAKVDELLASDDGGATELYGARVAAFRRVAVKRGAGGAPAEKVAEVVESALTAERPRTRYIVGRDARIRAGVERLPARARDRIYERLLLRD